MLLDRKSAGDQNPVTIHQEVLWKLVLTVGLLGSLCEGSISCKNEGGADVDWFILFKHPCGFQYVYTDSTNQNLKKGNKEVNHQESVLAHTLKPYFDKSAGSGFIAYNDQPPTGKSVAQTYGHSKGVVMMDSDTVVWLLHSTPNFPFGNKSNNFYPTSGKTNAQIFLCVTLENTKDTKIDQHLKGINAYIFDKHKPEILKASTTPPPPLPHSEDLKSKGGQEFKRFVKKVSATPEEGDLYVTIAETLQSDLYIQTWRSKEDNIYTTKNGYKLSIISSVTTPIGDCDNGNDHSKWCVSESKDWTCVADSNRQDSQFKRPGGALCINRKAVADAFRKLVTRKRPRSPSDDAPPLPPI